MLPARGRITGLAWYTGPADVIFASLSSRRCTGSTEGGSTVDFCSICESADAVLDGSVADNEPPTAISPARRVCTPDDFTVAVETLIVAIAAPLPAFFDFTTVVDTVTDSIELADFESAPRSSAMDSSTDSTVLVLAIDTTFARPSGHCLAANSVYKIHISSASKSGSLHQFVPRRVKTS